MSQRERVKALMLTPYGAPLRMAHRLTVRCRLGIVATVDRVRVRRDRERDAWLAEQLTVTAKTVLRPATARRRSAGRPRGLESAAPRNRPGRIRVAVAGSTP